MLARSATFALSVLLSLAAVGVQFHSESLVARAEGHPGYDIARLLRLLRAYR